MELPHLGQHCALDGCNLLDFLPFKCDACSQIYCLNHFKYDSHECQRALNRDNQVPVCPLCSQPVPPGKVGQLPDVAMSQHIDLYCRRNELLSAKTLAKPSSNLQRCSFKSCKQKDVIFLECDTCRTRFCVRHRHPSDHSCVGPPTVAANLADNWHSFKGSCSSSANSGFELLKSKARQASKSGRDAIGRLTTATQSNNCSAAHQPPLIDYLQGNISEQDALAIALEASKGGARQLSQEDADLELARALHESELEARRRRQQQRSPATNGNGNSARRDQCILS